jgi:hypothetical protein
MGIFTTPPKTLANAFFDARWDGDDDLAVEIYREMIQTKAKEYWRQEGFVMFIDNIKWEEVDELV